MSKGSPDLFNDEFLKKLEYLHIVSKKVFTGRMKAERRSKKVGSGQEFADHRQYTLGDDLRYVDWNVYGRLERLLLRLFEEEEDLSIYILLDCSQSMDMGKPSKFDHGRRLAAALAYIALANLDRVAILPFSEKMVDRLPPSRGKGRIFKVLQFLKDVQPGGTTRLADCMRTFVHQNPRRGLAVVISDLYDPDGFEEGLNYLRYNKFEPFLLHLYDKQEFSQPVYGDVQLADVETGVTKDVTLTQGLLKRYARAHNAFCKEVEGFCKSAQIPHFLTSVQQPFDELILEIFRAGGFLG